MSAAILETCRDRYYDDGHALRVRRQFNSNVKVGALAGTQHPEGYVRVQIDGRRYMAHRLLWLMRHGKWPTGEIDHIDGNPANNAPDNLRVVEHDENHRNRKRQRNNTSGVTGVRRDVRHGAWSAHIKVAGKVIHLGTFQRKSSAVSARRHAEREHGFHENHDRDSA